MKYVPVLYYEEHEQKDLKSNLYIIVKTIVDNTYIDHSESFIGNTFPLVNVTTNPNLTEIEYKLNYKLMLNASTQSLGYAGVELQLSKNALRFTDPEQLITDIARELFDWQMKLDQGEYTTGSVKMGDYPTKAVQELVEIYEEKD